MPADNGEEPKPSNRELAKKGEEDQFITGIWNRFIDTASTIPQGYDPVTWPIRMIDELEITIADSRASKDYPYSSPPRRNTVGEKLDPWDDSLKRIKNAYRIIGYTYLLTQPKNAFPWHAASSLRHQLEDEQRLYHTDAVSLNNTEAIALQRLCEAPKYTIDAGGIRTRQPAVPFDPKKRVYRISDVLVPKPQMK